MSNRNKEWIRWVIGLVLAIGAAYAGINIPAIQTPDAGPDTSPGTAPGSAIGAQLYTNFSALVVDVPTTFATATPGVVINSAGLGSILDLQDASTPVFTVNDAGTWSSTGAGTHGAGQTVNNWIKAAGPTAIATATPVVVIDSAGLSVLLDVRDAATPVFSINNGGAWSSTGAGTHSSGQTVNSWIVASAPTAIATSTPAAVIDSAGLSNILEVRDAATPIAQFQNGGALDLIANPIVQDIDTENQGVLPSIVSTAITYTAAAGGTGAVATVADGEIWIVHDVYVNVTTNFDCTGDDTTLVIGDGNDGDGFCVLADAELQAADTEGTGWAAGWQCQVAATVGVYGDENDGFIYAPSGAAETIDYLIDEGSGETITAGAATIYVVYTRIQ